MALWLITMSAVKVVISFLWTLNYWDCSHHYWYYSKLYSAGVFSPFISYCIVIVQFQNDAESKSKYVFDLNVGDRLPKLWIEKWFSLYSGHNRVDRCWHEAGLIMWPMDRIVPTRLIRGCSCSCTAPTLTILRLSWGHVCLRPANLQQSPTRRNIDTKLFISVKLFICFRYVKFENHPGGKSEFIIKMGPAQPQ